jgi:hypothetical protein
VLIWLLDCYWSRATGFSEDGSRAEWSSQREKENLLVFYWCYYLLVALEEK